MEPPRPRVPPPAPTSDVVKRALADARELLQLDVRIAKQELKEDLLLGKKALIAAAIAAALLLLAFGALAVAVILALGGTVGDALIVALALAVFAAAAGGVAFSMAPKPPLGRTRRRLQEDLNQLKEHVA